jgi:hypothetical protein
MSILSLETALQHLKITDADHDEAVQLALDNAESNVEMELKAEWDPAWTADTLPGTVRAAILLVLGALYENDGSNVGDTFERALAARDTLLVGIRVPTVA